MMSCEGLVSFESHVSRVKCDPLICLRKTYHIRTNLCMPLRCLLVTEQSTKRERGCNQSSNEVFISALSLRSHCINQGIAATAMAVGADLQEQLAAAIANHAYDSVAQLLDTSELQSRNPAVMEEWPHALHLLGHIYNKNLEDARFVWKRIPSSVKQDNAELQAVWRLLQFLWQRQYPSVWQALQSYAWSPQLQPFMQALAEKTRAELMDLISTAYSTVKPAKIAAICGLTEEEALSAAQAAGWRWNPSNGTLQVVKAPVAHNGLDEQATLVNLTQYMAHLEQ